ncbi:MAG TPA: hypothetical protein VLA36_02545 [Longimicrobiales bacterium]|nr:hypothetical protein [Longimicrobiales bacterium]
MKSTDPESVPGGRLARLMPVTVTSAMLALITPLDGETETQSGAAVTRHSRRPPDGEGAKEIVAEGLSRLSPIEDGDTVSVAGTEGGAVVLASPEHPINSTRVAVIFAR